MIRSLIEGSPSMPKKICEDTTHKFGPSNIVLSDLPYRFLTKDIKGGCLTTAPIVAVGH
jgi:hypothetical protein